MAVIKYNGKVLTEIAKGQTLTLHTDGHELEGDIVIEGFNGGAGGDVERVVDVSKLPEVGDSNVLYRVKNKNLTDILVKFGQTDVSFLLFYEAFVGIRPTIYNIDSLDEVSVPEVFPLGIYYVRSEEDIYAWTVAEGEEEPSWQSGLGNFDEETKLVFGYDTAYYKYGSAKDIKDVIIVENGEAYLLAEAFSVVGAVISYDTIATKDTADIKQSDINTFNLVIYYIEDEDDLFIYADVDENGTTEWWSLSNLDMGVFHGFVTSKDQATENGYYALGGDGYEKYFQPRGQLTLSTNGYADATDFSTVKVSIPEYTGRVVYE